MKKLLFALLLVAANLSAQDKDSLVTMPTLTVTSSAAVTNQVNQAFQKAFPDATNLAWFNVNKNYLAKFIQNDMRHGAMFAKNGYLKYDISYGYEKDLPKEIKDKVYGAYLDHKITNVANVKEEGRSIWVINLESMNRLLLVRVEGDEMEEVGNYDKSN